MDETEKRWRANVFVIYLLGFIFTLHATLPAYINSTFLSHYTTEQYVGILYSIASIVTICGFILIPRILRRFGNYKTMVTLLTVEFISLLAMAFSDNHYVISFFFIAGFLSIAIIGFNIDIFLERFSHDSDTGKIRGSFLSTVNIAWIITPLIVSFILDNDDYWKVFCGAALLLLPMIFILKNNLHDFRDPEYQTIPLHVTVKQIFYDRNIRDIFVVSFLLQFFYAWMVIYTPLYLTTHLAFSWSEIGVMFSIMLLPFVLSEAPLGRLADQRWGEKEVMTIGFLVMALATALMSFIESKSMIKWTCILFLSRVGASMVEIMSETYFFKKVDSQKANIIGFFRTMRPWAYVIAPLCATLLFYVTNIQYLFVVLAIIMCSGIYFSLELEDTK